MSRPVLTALIAGLLASTAAIAQPADDLVQPVPDARHFVIQAAPGKIGDSWLWIASDGSRMGREVMNLRGQNWSYDSKSRAGPDGLPTAVTVRGATPRGNASETFAISGDQASWKSPVDAGSTPADHAFYLAAGGPVANLAWLVEQLVARPDKTLKLLPSGQAHAEKLGSLDIGEGAQQQTVDLWAISGLETSPKMVWTDHEGRFFGASFAFLTWLPEAYASERQKLEMFRLAATTRRTRELAKSLPHVPPGPVAITHVRLFDADHLRFLDDQTVVTRGRLIAAVGPSSRVEPPRGATIIDGRGKTLLPGLWDCHKHVGGDHSGLQELSFGVTSVRDPGNIDAETLDRRRRQAAGELLFPHVYPSSLIDGKGPYTAQTANVAASQAEAIALVDKAKAEDFTAIKIYGSFDPQWLSATIAEAHRLGLHVHGHIPAGIRPLDAIAAGYDEVTHMNFLVMQGMPDSVVKASNSLQRVLGPGRYAKDLDLDSPKMKRLIATMAAKHIYADPTMVTMEGLLATDTGELSPAAIPYAEVLPAAAVRELRSGGLAPPSGLTRADYRASWAKMIELLGRLHRAGVPIVAGTDATGYELVHELEIYRQAGFSTEEALAAATIVPARLVGASARTGSIKAGKTADLVLVEGDPSHRLGDLRQTRVIMLEGALLDADELRGAWGLAGRPK